MEEKDFANGVEVTISSIEVETNPKDVEEVQRVVIKTPDGNITYKPKTMKEEFKDCFKVKSSVPMKFTELPQKLKDLARRVSEKGFARVRASYSIWNTTSDGKDVTYRYIRGTKMMDSWELLD